ncbi:hypothetical protein OTSANNIE_1631 [Anaplasma phagocytophilum str. Annie]|nr:hypothetical protein OTSANNIE_1631 [Anaplasma phagocytophilum str. Annie]
MRGHAVDLRKSHAFPRGARSWVKICVYLQQDIFCYTTKSLCYLKRTDNLAKKISCMIIYQHGLIYVLNHKKQNCYCIGIFYPTILYKYWLNSVKLCGYACLSYERAHFLMNATFVIPRVDNRMHFTAPRISFQTHKGVLGKICF